MNIENKIKLFTSDIEEYEEDIQEKYFNLFEGKVNEIERYAISKVLTVIDKAKNDLIIALQDCNEDDEEEAESVVERRISYLEEYFHLKELGEFFKEA